MTKAQHRHLLRFLQRYLGRIDFWLVGGPMSMRIAFPDIALLVGARHLQPFACQNRYFSLSFDSPSVTREHTALMGAISRATEHYAKGFPWLIDSVNAGKVFLENNPAMLHYLASTPSHHQHLFQDFLAVKNSKENTEGPLKDLIDFDKLQDIVFQIASDISCNSPGMTSGAEAPPWRSSAPLLAPRQRRLLFIDLLQGAENLSEELSLWTAAALGPCATILGAADWRMIEQHLDKETIVFCVGALRHPCTSFLLEHASRFHHVVFVEVGLNLPLDVMADRWRGGGKITLVPAANNYPGISRPWVSSGLRTPYIPIVSRKLRYPEISMTPSYDFFISANCQQDLTFLLRHELFFSRRRFLIGVRRCSHDTSEPILHNEDYWRTYTEVRKRFPQAVFVPWVPRQLHLYLTQLVRNIIIMYPNSWDRTSVTISNAMLSGRGIVTSPHPSLSRIDPACFLFYDHGARYSDRELKGLFCDERRSRRAAKNAERFACERLELARVMEDIVRKTLKATAR